MEYTIRGHGPVYTDVTLVASTEKFMKVPPSLYIWRIDVKSLEMAEAKSKEFSYFIATRSMNDTKGAAADAYKRYSVEWWSGHLMTGVHPVGELKRVDGVSLHGD